MNLPQPRTLADAVAQVVAADLCSGCGLCARLHDGITMGLDAQGYQRPRVDASAASTPVDSDALSTFDRSCPGVRVAPPSRAPGDDYNPTFGPYLEAWTAWAVDAQVRHNGSSGGVLTALSSWLIDSAQVDAAVCAGQSEQPTETASRRYLDAADVLTSAGSRYAPVATLSTPSGASDVVVAKPCEAAALRAATTGDHRSPLILSFFCAGVPSQGATDRLAAQLLGDNEPVAAVRYRGDGWPGRFRVTAVSGRSASTSYEKSWGEHLGRELQWRCKLCVDGTGTAADISVGDYWQNSGHGYPVFDDAPGRCIVLIRTERGRALLHAAVEAQVIAIEPVDVEDAERGQPLQMTRRRTLAGRVAGARAAGRRVPSYRGWGMWRLAARDPRATYTAARRSFGRSRGTR